MATIESNGEAAATASSVELGPILTGLGFLTAGAVAAVLLFITVKGVFFPSGLGKKR